MSVFRLQGTSKIASCGCCVPTVHSAQSIRLCLPRLSHAQTASYGVDDMGYTGRGSNMAQISLCTWELAGGKPPSSFTQCVGQSTELVAQLLALCLFSCVLQRVQKTAVWGAIPASMPVQVVYICERLTWPFSRGVLSAARSACHRLPQQTLHLDFERYCLHRPVRGGYGIEAENEVSKCGLGILIDRPPKGMPIIQ